MKNLSQVHLRSSSAESESPVTTVVYDFLTGATIPSTVLHASSLHVIDKNNMRQERKQKK